MNIVWWILLILGGLLAATVVALVIAAAVGFSVLEFITGLFHAFKKPPPPGDNDANWSPDQGSEAR